MDDVAADNFLPLPDESMKDVEHPHTIRRLLHDFVHPNVAVCASYAFSAYQQARHRLLSIAECSCTSIYRSEIRQLN